MPEEKKDTQMYHAIPAIMVGDRVTFFLEKDKYKVTEIENAFVVQQII